MRNPTTTLQFVSYRRIPTDADRSVLTLDADPFGLPAATDPPELASVILMTVVCLCDGTARYISTEVAVGDTPVAKRADRCAVTSTTLKDRG